MIPKNRLGGADPTDLPALRGALAAADPDAGLAPIGMERVEIGAEALYRLPQTVADLVGDRGAPRVVMVVDATPMSRGRTDLKSEAGRLLADVFETRRAVIGAGRTELHGDERALAETENAVQGADCAVVVGSGTITDLAKEATRRAGGVPLVVVQTAASVNAFSDDMAVLLQNGAKRTVPSRWPDALLVDLSTLADAPPEMNLAGFGDLISGWTAPADWYLATAIGMDDSYHPAPVAMLREGGRALLDAAPRLRDRDPEALELLARVLTLSGFTMGTAGKTAPLSGTEHLVSHLIDMAAEQRGLPLALHGAQVGVAAIPVAAAWEVFLGEFDPTESDLLFPDDATMEPLVKRAFANIDPTGRVGDECWASYAVKLERWRENRSGVVAFLAAWPEHRAEIAGMVLPPERLAGALGDAGAPARFGALSPPASEDVARWAFANCHLMRDRFTLADLLFFAGWWDEAFVERLLDRARAAGGGL